MVTLVDAGVPAAQAAEAALTDAVAGAVPEPTAAVMPAVHPLTEAMVLAAAQYDDRSVTTAIQEAVAELGWAGALGGVVLPSLVQMGERWRRGDLPLSTEHFLSAVVRRELLAGNASMAEPAIDAPLVVLACPEDEQHDLGATALWLLLREAGLRVVFLGADVPAAALVMALHETDADAVSISATAPNSLPMLELAAREVVSARVRARIFVGGPALADEEGASGVPGIRLPREIAAAAETLVQGVSGKT